MLHSKKSKIIVIVAAALALLTIVGLLVPILSVKNGDVVTGSGSFGSISKVEPPHGLGNADYYRLYVQNGLVACYLAYDANSLTLVKNEVDGGVVQTYAWKNYVSDGKDATLTNASVWRVMDGGVGYRWYYGSEVRSGGAVVLPYDEYVDVENYEVEIAAKFLGVTSEETGVIYNVGETYSDAVYQAETTFRFGVVHSTSYLTSSSFTNYDRRNRWYASNLPYNKHYDVEKETCVKLGHESAFRSAGWSADQYAVTMNFKNIVNRAAGSASPSLEYRFKGELVGAISGNTYPISMNGYEYTDTVSRFTLFNGYPCVLYSVRLYEGELSEADKLRNSFVDFCAFYDVNVSSILALDADTRTEFLESCGTLADVRNVTMGNLNANEMQENREKVLRIISECWPS